MSQKSWSSRTIRWEKKRVNFKTSDFSVPSSRSYTVLGLGLVVTWKFAFKMFFHTFNSNNSYYVKAKSREIQDSCGFRADFTSRYFSLIFYEDCIFSEWKVSCFMATSGIYFWQHDHSSAIFFSRPTTSIKKGNLSNFARWGGGRTFACPAKYLQNAAFFCQSHSWSLEGAFVYFWETRYMSFLKFRFSLFLRVWFLSIQVFWTLWYSS